MSEVCHALGMEMGRLWAPAVSPVSVTELGFNGEQNTTVLSPQLCNILKPRANRLSVCAGKTALPVGREGGRVPEAWQMEGR